MTTPEEKAAKPVASMAKTVTTVMQMTARDMAVMLLVGQGLDKAWVESHVGEAEFTADGLCYKLRLDEPIKYVQGVFEIEEPT